MGKTLYRTFTILIFFVLIGKILNWFLDFSVEINQVLNIIMFTLIGIAYMVMGYVWDNKVKQVVITTCGFLLIVTNFFNNTVALNIIRIASIIIPMLIARFYKEEGGQVSATRVD